MTATANDHKAQGIRLKNRRKALKLSANDLANALQALGQKVSRGAIANWECGKNGIVANKLPALAKVLQCSESYLLTGVGEVADITEFTPNQIARKTGNLSTIATNNRPQNASSPAKLPIFPIVPNELPKKSPQIQPISTALHNTSKQSSDFFDSNFINHILQSSDFIMQHKRPLKKSSKLANVCYDIRGALLQTANQMESEGQKIIKLNIGNPAPFGLFAPDEIIQDVASNLHNAEGYSDSRGIFSARKAILQYYQGKGLHSATDVNDVYIGNGVSELIVMSLQALLDDGDEVLIPMPDYPLWTAAANLAGGRAVHYRCDEDNDWQPNLADLESKITDKTKAIVVINPNNPTGTVYSDEMLKAIADIATRYGLVLMADEIYDRILYDGVSHTPMCTIAHDCLVLSFNGLSKSHRIAGFRSGWLMISGQKDGAEDFIEGLTMLASMRLCANVPAQYAIQTAMGGYQSMQALTAENGRLNKQRMIAYNRLNAIKGVSCTLPKGAFYCFAKIDLSVYPIENDMDFMMDLLKEEKVLMVQGTGFNWDKPDHFRVVFLPNVLDLEEAMDRLERFFAKKRLQFGTE